MSLGRSISIAEYFAASAATDEPRTCGPDDYVSPYLRQAYHRCDPDPLSRWPAFWRCWAQLQTAGSMLTQAALVSSSHELTDQVRRLLCRLQQQLDELAIKADGQTTPAAREAAVQLKAAAAAVLGHAVGGNPTKEENQRPAGWLVINPRSHVDRTLVPALAAATTSDSVYAWAGSADAVEQVDVIVDVPGHGFVWLDAVRKTDATPAAPLLGVAEDDQIILRNEFFEAHIDRDTGALRSLYDFVARGNRLSQRLVSCSKNEQSTTMVAESVRLEMASPVRAQVRSTGRLVGNGGQTLAEFDLVHGIERGSRLLDVRVNLARTRSLEGDPWQDYLGLRSMWANAAARLVRWTNELPYVTRAKQLESPLLYEIDDVGRRTSILGLGLAYHRLSADDAADTLLCVRGESERSFKFCIGVDLPHPLSAALTKLSGSTAIAMDKAAAKDQAWLIHCSSRQVYLVDWRPLAVDGASQFRGFRVAVLETAGRRQTITIRAFCPIREACATRTDDHSDSRCEVVEGTIRLSLQPYEWTQVEARW